MTKVKELLKNIGSSWIWVVLYILLFKTCNHNSSLEKSNEEKFAVS